MHFTSMISMWFALTLPLIVLMYILKRKYEDTVVPSHMLWNRVLKELEANRPWQRLNIRLLLILQLLAAFFLVLALMQPMLHVSGKNHAHAVLVLDRSASMQILSSDGESRLDRAKQQVMDYVNEGRADEYTLILMGSQPEMIVSRTTSSDVVIDAVHDVTIDYGETNILETISLAESLTTESHDGIVVFTDGWWPEHMSFNEQLTFIPSSDSEPVQNVVIAQFGVKETEQGETLGSGVIGNKGEVEQSIDVSLYVDGQLTEVQERSIAAGEQQPVYFSNLPKGEVFKLEIEADDDQVLSDNIYHAFLSSNQVKTALLVGNHSSLFLQRALELSGVRVIQSQADENGRFIYPDSPIDFIVLNGVGSVQLQGETWENSLDQLPVWAFGSLLTGDSTPLPNDRIEIAEHPVTQYVQLSDTHIAEAVQVEQLPWLGLTPIASKGDVPLVYAGDDAGQRKLVFTFHLSDSDLPLRSDFPIIVQNAAGWLADSSHDHLGTAVAGSQIVIPLAIEADGAVWEVVELYTATESEAYEAGEAQNIYTVPSVPGLYRFVEHSKAGESIRSRYLQVVSHPKETETYHRPIWEREMPSDGSEAENGSIGGADRTAADMIGTTDVRSETPLAPWIALFVMCIVILEWGVYQRARSV